MTDQIVIIVCLFFSAFFSGMEIAFISANKLNIEVQSRKGTWLGRMLSRFASNPGYFLGTTLVGNNLALVLFGIFTAKLMEPSLQEMIPGDSQILVLVVQTLVSTIIVLVTAEFLPKSIFLLNPDRMLTALALPMSLIYWSMYPVTVTVVEISKFFIIKVFRYEYSEERPVFGLTDLNNYLKQTLSAQDIDEQEVDAKILNNAIEFKAIRIRECMIPRTEVVAVEVNESVEVLKQAFIESGHSKIIVFKDSIDDIIGYCHSLEMFRKPEEIKNILTPIIIAPETMLANELLVQFIKERKSLAWVVDEYGGTSGIVSMEDVMEEIFGEIHDEHDEDDLTEQQLEDGSYLLSARQEIDHLNDKLNLGLPEGEYDTLGGLILSFNEDLPDLNQEIEIDGFNLKVMSMEDHRIDTVKLTSIDSQEA